MKPTDGRVKQSSAATYRNGKKNRRIRARERLEAQLVAKVKNTNDGPVPLEEKDIKRINKELETLKNK